MSTSLPHDGFHDIAIRKRCKLTHRLITILTLFGQGRRETIAYSPIRVCTQEGYIKKILVWGLSLAVVAKMID